MVPDWSREPSHHQSDTHLTQIWTQWLFKHSMRGPTFWRSVSWWINVFLVNDCLLDVYPVNNSDLLPHPHVPQGCLERAPYFSFNVYWTSWGLHAWFSKFGMKDCLMDVSSVNISFRFDARPKAFRDETASTLTKFYLNNNPFLCIRTNIASKKVFYWLLQSGAFSVRQFTFP